jgi:hypothetical protein
MKVLKSETDRRQNYDINRLATRENKTKKSEREAEAKAVKFIAATPKSEMNYNEIR